jgi:SPP1 family predicted phage head-tail adaptor
MSLSAGKLRHRIAIEQKVDTPDPITGYPVTVWQSVAEVWAEITPLSVREFVAAQATQSAVTGRVRIRWRTGITAAMRIRHLADDRIYNIAGVLEDSRSGREWLTLPVSEGANDG